MVGDKPEAVDETGVVNDFNTDEGADTGVIGNVDFKVSGTELSGADVGVLGAVVIAVDLGESGSVN